MKDLVSSSSDRKLKLLPPFILFPVNVFVSSQTSDSELLLSCWSPDECFCWFLSSDMLWSRQQLCKCCCHRPTGGPALWIIYSILTWILNQPADELDLILNTTSPHQVVWPGPGSHPTTASLKNQHLTLFWGNIQTAGKIHPANWEPERQTLDGSYRF